MRERERETKHFVAPSSNRIASTNARARNNLPERAKQGRTVFRGGASFVVDERLFDIIYIMEAVCCRFALPVPFGLAGWGGKPAELSLLLPAIRTRACNGVSLLPYNANATFKSDYLTELSRGHWTTNNHLLCRRFSRAYHIPVGRISHVCEIPNLDGRHTRLQYMSPLLYRYYR